MTQRTQYPATPAMSAADKAAHDKASYVRGNTTVCPLCQRPANSGHQCTGLTDTGLKALARLETAVGNWVPFVAPTPTPVLDDAWDTVIDAYSYAGSAA